MVELDTGRAARAAGQLKDLDGYDRRLERAARRVDEADRERATAALMIYESVLSRSGKPASEVREMVRRFKETWEDEEEEPLTIPRVSGIMNIEGTEWFFDDADLRRMTGRLLGQFQHRVAQYNYVDEAEVLKRWANSYDTRLFIRRRIYDTEPVAGVVAGMDLALMQYLRVAAGGNTVVLTENLVRMLLNLGLLDDEAADEYEALAAAEGLALHLDLPAPIVGEILEDLAREGITDFPEPEPEPEPEPTEPETAEPETGPEPGETAAADELEESPPEPSAEDRAARREARRAAERGEEPSRVQDPQAKDAPGVEEESGQEEPASPETGRDDAPGRA